MNSTHLSPAAKQLLGECERDAVNQFDAVVLENGLWTRVGEDDQLMALCQAVAEADHAHDVRHDEFEGASDDSNIPSLTEHAHDLLERTLEQRVAECIALQCRETLEAEGAYYEDVDADDLAMAQREAANWLLEHEDITVRLWGSADVVDEPGNGAIIEGP